ncbi:MAG: hypothetical protein GX273_10150 [Bacteroidales bacterium]|nr:hypothetical protein [Bacteroidales bacterium]
MSFFRPRLIALCSFFAFYLSLSYNEKKEYKLLKFKDILIVSYILAFVFIIYTFGDFSFKYREINEYGALQFTMGLGNPNAVSFYVLFACMILLINILTTKSNIQKLFDFVLIGFMAYILLLLRSRMVLLCLAIAIFALFFKKKKKANTIIAGIMMTIPIAAVPFLLYQNTKLKSLELLGKAVDTGRYEIYSEFLNELKSAPLQYIFGNFKKYAFYNLHNGPMSIIATIGIVGFILYMIFWINEIKNITKNMQSRYQTVAYVFILLFFLHSASEAMSVIGTIPYSIFILLIVKIAKGQIKMDNEIIEKPQEISNNINI